MAIAAGTVWEVRAAGNDANGGGFVAGAAGTDYSQQDAAQYGGANLAVDGAVNTKVTSATHNFVAADVGNILQVTAGAGWTQGFYQILSVAANAATLDRSPAAAGTGGGTYAVGGALASPGKAGSGAVSGNVIWIKAATYPITSATANVAGGCLTLPGQTLNTNVGRIIGYSLVRGDGGRPLLQAGSISTFTVVTTGIGNSAENLIIDCASRTSSRGIQALNGRAVNCKVLNCSNIGINGGVQVLCEATGCSGGTAGLSPFLAFGCWSHDNTVGGCAGFTAPGANGAMVDCIASGNGGAGFHDASAAGRFVNCTAYGNGLAGFIANVGAGLATTDLINVLSYGNAGAGIQSAANIGVAVYSAFLGNNTGGATTGGMTIADQVNLTADPFVNGAAGNFALNTAPGGGALVRGAGLPGTFPGLLARAWLDGGAVQHRDTGQAFTFIS